MLIQCLCSSEQRQQKEEEVFVSSTEIANIPTPLKMEKFNNVGVMKTFLETKKVADLVVGDKYLITKVKKVQTKFGSAVVVELDNAFCCFLPKRFSSLEPEDLQSFEEECKNKEVYLVVEKSEESMCKKSVSIKFVH